MIVRSRILSRSIFFMLFGCSLFPFSPSVSTRLHADDAAAEATSGNPKALKYFRVLQKRPSPGYVFDRFYNAWLDTDSVESLEAFLENTVKEEENTPNRLLLAFFYAKHGENVRALEQFRTALERDPGSADAWYQKALVEQRTLDFDTAIADLGKALDANPKPELERDIIQLQGRVHVRNGDTEKARTTWNALLEKNPDDEQLQEDLIELQISEGMFEIALATAEGLQKKTKDQYMKVLRRLRIGDIHQRAGERKKALEAYSSTIESVGNTTWIEKEILSQIERVFRREYNHVRPHSALGYGAPAPIAAIPRSTDTGKSIENLS